MPGEATGKFPTATTLNILTQESLGLYIHLPWCVRKCPYCDFNSHAIKQEFPEQQYVSALISDMEFESTQLGQYTIGSIFLGGGTPSLFSGTSIARILDSAANLLSLSDDCEVTLEANPGAADAEHFRLYRQAGVNRLSLGFQSMDNDQLRSLGRIHSAEESLEAYEVALSAGFKNINIDLMFGLPGQSVAKGLEEVERVMALEPQHISWYQLTIEPNTAFAYAPPSLPDEDQVDILHEEGIGLMASRGYQRYEVSAYAQPGQRCQHNLNYWNFGDYLGLGAGAHGKITTIAGAQRYARYKHPSDYIHSAGTRNVYQQFAPIDDNDLLLEFLLNSLRLVEGFTLKRLHLITGLDKHQLTQQLSEPLEKGLLEINHDRCRATDKGYRYLNEILLPLMPT